ncbi:type II secretion system minor pseudopilin [Candidatus Marithrix sp. Canyon 246]|uniref:general secretion pathway protein GspK n=1 Tax=Candidatus Marithrix sp. Canyon 246 TaxID=1827136 RepID=UPI00084A24A7|nr:type II secretion system protein GspK [Candidatus Marithrix sp. Canyon 246]
MSNSQQNGAILIVVLWFIVIVTIMVATLSSETRLSTKIVFYNKMGLQTWNDTLAALRAAEMELLINKMPDPPGTEEDIDLSLRRDKKFRFNGEVLELAYPSPETVNVRIYNNAGKINIQKLSKAKVRELLEMFVGMEDLERLTTLENAWQDWIDKDDMPRLDGAEKDYYEGLTPPYEPRNAPIETVSEVLLIKGFDEVFKDIEMENVFTVYGGTVDGINPNFASREALMLLPGMDTSIIDRIMTVRRVKEIKSVKDFAFLVEPEQMALFRSWVKFSTSNFYTIAIQTKPVAEIAAIQAKKAEEQEQEVEEANELEPEIDDPFHIPASTSEKQSAYMVTIQPKGNNQLPIIYKVNPYGVLPDTRHEHIPIERLQEMLENGMLELEGAEFNGGGSSMPF